MIPTLPTLSTICRVYGVGLSYFFGEPTRHTLAITRKAHLQGTTRGAESVRVTPLNASNAGCNVSAHMIEFPPGGTSVAIDATHESNGVVYVLEGKLRLEAGGLQEILEAGDCACMDSEMPLAWSSADKHRCRVLAVLPLVSKGK
jgi:quercetin dioxygenase-like cupin family protein